MPELQTLGKVMALTGILLIVGGIAALLTGRPIGALCVLLMGATTALWSLAVLWTAAGRREPLRPVWGTPEPWHPDEHNGGGTR